MKFEDFASGIGIHPEYLLRIIKNKYKLYRKIIIPKSNGKFRKIDAPNQELKSIQRWILLNYLNPLPVFEFTFGFRKNFGIGDNAIIHLKQDYILNLDITDFFPSIKTNKIISIFNDIGFEQSDARLITELCVLNGHLPQGAPTSPALSNLAFKDIDLKISELCNNELILYSRYADDISLSSNSLSKLKLIYKNIKKILSENGFNLNGDKTRYLSPNNRMDITGLRINNGILSIGRNRKRRLRALLHHYVIKENEVNLNKILGYLSFLKDIEPKRYAEFIVYIKKLYERKTT